MSAKDKELQLRDLCTRLQYGVMCKTTNSDKPQRLKGIIRHHKLWWFEFDGFRSIECKPYLRSMSSMTEEEKEELVDFGLAYWDNGKHTDENGSTIIYGGKEIQIIPDIETYDWLNRHHFDYRGLIEKGLALEALDGMYK